MFDVTMTSLLSILKKNADLQWNIDQNWIFCQKISKYQNFPNFGLYKKEMTFLTYTLSFKTCCDDIFQNSYFWYCRASPIPLSSDFDGLPYPRVR